LTIWHCILNVELIKTHSFRLFFGDFAHWVVTYLDVIHFFKKSKFKKISSSN